MLEAIIAIIAIIGCCILAGWHIVDAYKYINRKDQ